MDMYSITFLTEIVSILVFIGWAKVQVQKTEVLSIPEERFNPCFYWMSEGTPKPRLDSAPRNPVSILVFIGWAKVHAIWLFLEGSINSFNPCFYWMSEGTFVIVGHLEINLLVFQSLFLLDERRYIDSRNILKYWKGCFNPCFYWMSEGTSLRYSGKRMQDLFQSLFLLDERRYWIIRRESVTSWRVSILVFIGWAKVPHRLQRARRVLMVVSILVFIGWAKVPKKTHVKN